MANDNSNQTKTSQNMATSVISGAKTATSVAKAAGKAVAGDIAGAIIDVLKDENLRRIIAAIIIIGIIIVYGLSMLGPSITGSIQNLEQLYEEQYDAIYQQYAIEANGSTFALYTFDAENAKYTAILLTIKQYIESLFTNDSKYDNSALSESEKTVLLDEDYQNTLNAIKNKESLVGEDGALQTRIDLIKGRVEQRGEQLSTIATAQYELTMIGMAIGEYLDSVRKNPVLFAGVDLENSSFNVHSEAFELSDIQALKILAAYSIQNDCNINNIDMWELMNYCGWYSTETEAIPTIDDEESIYDTTIEAHYGMEIGGVVDAGDTISTTVKYIDPPQVPFWDGSCAPQWYYEEIAQLYENNENYDYYESKEDTEALKDMLHYETTENGDIDISNFENLSKYQTFGIVDQVYVASIASLTVTRTEYESALNLLDEALSNLYGSILEKWKALFGTGNSTTPAGNSIFQKSDGTIGVTIYTSNNHQYFLMSYATGWTSEHKTGTPDGSVTFSGLSPNTTYTVYESWGNPAIPSDIQNVSIDTFTTPNGLPNLQAYKIQLEMDVSYTARSVDEMICDVLGLWPGSLAAVELGTDEHTLYPEDHLDNELLKYTWTDTYTDPSGTKHTVEFSRQQGYQAEAYEDYIMAIAETMGYDTTGIFGSDVGFGNTIVEVAMAEYEYYHANNLHEGARYWDMAYEAGGISVRYDGSVAWCVCFVMTCAWQCGLLEDGAAWEKVNWIFYCSGLYSNLVDTGTAVGYCTAGSTYKPVPGDIVFFGTHVTRYNLAHVGIVKEVLDDGTLVTIEGNTSDSLEIRTYPNYLLGSKIPGSGRVISAYCHPNYPAPYLTNPLYETIGNYIHPTINARLISDNGKRIFIAGLGRFRWSQMPDVLNMLNESYPELYKEELRTAYEANDQSAFIKTWNEIAKSNKKDKFKAAQRNILNKLYVDPVVQAIKAQTGFDWRQTTAREELLLGIVTTTDSRSACINLLKALTQNMDNSISDAEFLEAMCKNNHLYNTAADYQNQMWPSDPKDIRTKWLKGIQALLKKVIKVEEEKTEQKTEKTEAA